MIIEIAYNHYKLETYVGYILGTISVVCTTIYTIKIIRYALIEIPGSRKVIRGGIEEPKRGMYIPMMILSILSIINGYMVRDIVIGIGNNIYGNSINIIPSVNEITNRIKRIETMESNIIEIIIKNIPIIIIIGIIIINIVRKRIEIKEIIERGSGLRPRKGIKRVRRIIEYITKGMEIDNIYNNIVIRNIYKLGKIIGKRIDKGILEILIAHGMIERIKERSKEIGTWDNGNVYKLIINIILGVIIIDNINTIELIIIITTGIIIRENINNNYNKISTRKAIYSLVSRIKENKGRIKVQVYIIIYNIILNKLGIIDELGMTGDSDKGKGIKIEVSEETMKHLGEAGIREMGRVTTEATDKIRSLYLAVGVATGVAASVTKVLTKAPMPPVAKAATIVCSSVTAGGLMAVIEGKIIRGSKNSGGGNIKEAMEVIKEMKGKYGIDGSKNINDYIDIGGLYDTVENVTHTICCNVNMGGMRSPFEGAPGIEKIIGGAIVAIVGIIYLIINLASMLIYKYIYSKGEFRFGLVDRLPIKNKERVKGWIRKFISYNSKLSNYWIIYIIFALVVSLVILLLGLTDVFENMDIYIEEYIRIRGRK